MDEMGCKSCANNNGRVGSGKAQANAALKSHSSFTAGASYIVHKKAAMDGKCRAA